VVAFGRIIALNEDHFELPLSPPSAPPVLGRPLVGVSSSIWSERLGVKSVFLWELGWNFGYCEEGSPTRCFDVQVGVVDIWRRAVILDVHKWRHSFFMSVPPWY